MTKMQLLGSVRQRLDAALATQKLLLGDLQDGQNGRCQRLAADAVAGMTAESLDEVQEVLALITHREDLRDQGYDLIEEGRDPEEGS